MSNFVRCQDGTWVNLDLVSRIVPVKKTDRIEGGYYEFFFTTEGWIEKSEYGFDPSSAAPVVAALPGEAVIEFYTSTTERRPTSSEDLIMAETSIVGWRCGQSGLAKPVTYEAWDARGHASNAYLYRMSDGRFKALAKEMCLESMDDAKRYALRLIQKQYDD
jgi:hypothetical protein